MPERGLLQALLRRRHGRGRGAAARGTLLLQRAIRRNAARQARRVRTVVGRDDAGLRRRRHVARPRPARRRGGRNLRIRLLCRHVRRRDDLRLRGARRRDELGLPELRPESPPATARVPLRRRLLARAVPRRGAGLRAALPRVARRPRRVRRAVALRAQGRAARRRAAPAREGPRLRRRDLCAERGPRAPAQGLPVLARGLSVRCFAVWAGWK